MFTHVWLVTHVYTRMTGNPKLFLWVFSQSLTSWSKGGNSSVQITSQVQQIYIVFYISDLINVF
jgi:hypothetical protein